MTELEDRLDRLYEMPPWPVFLVVEGNVNLNDLLDMRPGSIIRMSEPDDIRVVHVDDRPVGCVAGWISEE